MELFSYIITGVIAYLLGSINTAIIISALSGKDIRKEGSGNAGATNTLRVMGKKAAALVALFDALKGVFAVIIARVVSSIAGIDANIPVCISALLVVLGHIYPVYFGFKGGKGIATSFGSLLFVFPVHALLALLVFIVLVAITHYVSVGSVAAAVALPLFLFITHSDNMVVCILTACIGVQPRSSAAS